MDDSTNWSVLSYPYGKWENTFINIRNYNQIMEEIYRIQEKYSDYRYSFESIKRLYSEFTFPINIKINKGLVTTTPLEEEVIYGYPHRGTEYYEDELYMMKDEDICDVLSKVLERLKARKNEFNLSINIFKDFTAKHKENSFPNINQVNPKYEIAFGEETFEESNPSYRADSLISAVDFIQHKVNEHIWLVEDMFHYIISQGQYLSFSSLLQYRQLMGDYYFPECRYNKETILDTNDLEESDLKKYEKISAKEISAKEIPTWIDVSGCEKEDILSDLPSMYYSEEKIRKSFCMLVAKINDEANKESRNYKCENIFQLLFALADYMSTFQIRVKTCPCCGKLFRYNRNGQKGDTHYKFCSSSCNKQYQSEKNKYWKSSLAHKEKEKVQKAKKYDEEHFSGLPEYEAYLEELNRKYEEIKIMVKNKMSDAEIIEACVALKDFRKKEKENIKLKSKGGNKHLQK